MTSTENPRDEPVEAASPSADPPITPPVPSRRAGWRRIPRRSALGLVAAFLLGACLCGGIGLAVGALADHGFGESSHEDGRGGHGRDGRGDPRGDDDQRGSTATPAPTATPTTAPATPSPATPSPAASASPSATS